jgi:hypothetical protein
MTAILFLVGFHLSSTSVKEHRMILNVQQDQDTLPESNVNETLPALILPYLDSSTLANVAATSQALFQQVCQRDELWDPVFQKLANGIMRPNSRWYWLFRIPPPIPRSAFCRVVEDETTGMSENRLLPMLYQKRMWTRALATEENGVLVHDTENGVLVDFFRVPEGGAMYYAFRDFPVFCSDCSVSLATTRELFDHCSTDAHIFAKCPELLDPRRKESFETFTFYGKAKALGEYRARIESYFRKASMVFKNQQVLRGVTWRLRKQFPTNCSIFTVENVTEACIQWAIRDFISGNIAEAVMGAYEGYRGWQCTRFKKLGVVL